MNILCQITPLNALFGLSFVNHLFHGIFFHIKYAITSEKDIIINKYRNRAVLLYIKNRSQDSSNINIDKILYFIILLNCIIFITLTNSLIINNDRNHNAINVIYVFINNKIKKLII